MDGWYGMDLYLVRIRNMLLLIADSR